MNQDTLQERFLQPNGWQWHWIKNQDGVMLRAGSSLAEKSRVHVVYVEGLNEFAEKTFELAREFNNNSINFHVLDRRGQGLSGRYLRNKFKVHAKDFTKDAQDVLTHIRQTIPEDEPVFLLGHSTGAIIATLALKKESKRFAGAVFTSPFFGFREKAAQGHEPFISSLNIPGLRGLSLNSGKKWDVTEIEQSRFKLSCDPERNSLKKYWYTVNPALRTGGPTLGFVASAARAINKIKKPAFLKDLNTPIHIFSGGHDTMVDTKAMLNAFKNLPQATYSYFPTGRHELLMERDKIRTPVMNQTFEFIRKHSP